MKLFTIFPLTILFWGTIFPIEFELTDTYWSLIKIENTATNRISLPDTICRITLHFANNGAYNGFSGCYHYFGSYIIEEAQKISMNNPLRPTSDCPSCQLGESLFDSYPKTNKYSIQTDTLTLWTDNKIKITFKKIIKRKE
jgi:heat shock protein HslJ